MLTYKTKLTRNLPTVLLSQICKKLRMWIDLWTIVISLDLLMINRLSLKEKVSRISLLNKRNWWKNNNKSLSNPKLMAYPTRLYKWWTRDSNLRLTTDFTSKATKSKGRSTWMNTTKGEKRRLDCTKNLILPRKELTQIKTTTGTDQPELLSTSCIMIFWASKNTRGSCKSKRDRCWQTSLTRIKRVLIM